MRKIEISPNDKSLLRKIMPLLCLAIPWEVYFYSSGWGIKFSVFYANFDIQYGTLFVSITKQMTLLSNGGFLPSIRTLAWVFGAILCLMVVLYELRENDTKTDQSAKKTGMALVACGILTFISSIAVWNSYFKTFPIAPFFFIAFGYLLLKAENEENNTGIES